MKAELLQGFYLGDVFIEPLNGQVMGPGISEHLAPKAMEVLKGMLDADARILKDPAPEVMTWAMAASSVDINMRAWVNVGDYWPTLFDLRKTVKVGLEDAGFTIPFPQQDVYMHQVTETASK